MGSFVDDVLLGDVNGVCSCLMITSLERLKLDSFHELRQRWCSLQGHWFQQDETISHSTSELLEFLRSKFKHCVVLRRLFPKTVSSLQILLAVHSLFKSVWLLPLGVTCKDKVFSSAPRSLTELKEVIGDNWAHVTRGMLTLTVLQVDLEFQGTHI